MPAGLSAAGACCVLAGSGGWGLLVARQLRRRPAELAGLAAVLEALRTEIDYARTPLPDALRRAAGDGGGPAGALFRQTARLLEAGGGLGAAQAWGQALVATEQRSAWAREDVAELSRLGGALGVSDAADQVRHLALAVARLRAAEAAASAGLERQARMWAYLGVLGGLALVLAVL